MRLPTKKIAVVTELTGFRPMVLEKTVRLMGLLNTMQNHPFLKEKLALKGGAALNLFFFDIQRLSTNISLNYVGTGDRDTVLEERSKLERILPDVFVQEGFTISFMSKKSVNSGWSLQYQSAFGQNGIFEVDVNFMCRTPLFPVRVMDSRPLGRWKASGIRVMNIHELVAEKLVALLTRHRTKDLFDVQRIFHRRKLTPEWLRIAYLVYGAVNRKDWRTVAVADAELDTEALARQLAPMLPLGTIQQAGGTEHYGKTLVEKCRQALSAVLPLHDSEREFLDLLLDKGEIDAAILTADTSLQSRIQKHPFLEHKALDVRQHKVLS